MPKEIAFAKKVKNEIASASYEKEQKRFILSGFVRNGAVFTLGKIPSLILKTEVASAARLLYSCLKEVYGLEPTIHYEEVVRFGRGVAYVVQAEDPRLYEVMEDLEILKDGFDRIPPSEGVRRRNLKYLLIGSFLANGSVNNPSSGKTSYFLEMAFTDKQDALAVKKKLLTFKEERTMAFKYIKRRDKHVLYLKKSDQITVFLAYIGATEAMFKYENARIMKDDINTNNRQANCDAANYKKSIEAAKKDIEDLDYLLAHKPLKLFERREQLVIMARKENPEFNYRELAEHISAEGEITITKSGVVHILSDIREEVADLRRKNS